MSVSDLAPGKWILEKSENFDEYMKAIGEQDFFYF